MTSHQSRLGGIGLCWGCVPDVSILQLAELAARHGFSEIHVQPAQLYGAGVSPANCGRGLMASA
jgi:pyruvate/2-oxoglutarate dehydrogenase complex dihydrolipoamide dehydrogenase (E3) component